MTNIMAIAAFVLLASIGVVVPSKSSYANGFAYALESYSQIWCMPMKSSGDLVGLFDLFSVNKFHAFNHLCQVFEAA